MAFLEIQFPPRISYGASGGPGYRTDVVVLESGYEVRNQLWSVSRGKWDVAHGVKSQSDFNELNAFFRIAKGRTHGFRFKDWLDYQVASSEGRLGTGAAGTGLPTYQLYKRYANAAGSEDRKIVKPVAGAVTVYRNAGPVTIGAGAGQIAIDSTTGIVTFVADASATANSITPGATTQVVLATNPGTLVAGQLLYLSGFAGADAALVNGLAHTINVVAGAGPYTFTLATNTAGKTITLGTGQGRKYPQTTDALTWSGELDVPARFDVDDMGGAILAPNNFEWRSIPVVELRS